MSEPTKEELNESIDLLTAYRTRLENEVTSMGKKLQISQEKINLNLKANSELININNTLDRLNKQLESQN